MILNTYGKSPLSPPSDTEVHAAAQKLESMATYRGVIVDVTGLKTLSSLIISEPFGGTPLSRGLSQTDFNSYSYGAVFRQWLAGI